jgi:hypothetical protein
MNERMATITRRDWVLLVIAAAQGKAMTPAQLQKALFLIGQEHPEAVGEDYYDFIPYDYGPFCVDIYHDAIRLRLEDKVQIVNNGRWNDYYATPIGMKSAAELREGLSTELGEYIDRTVSWIRRLSFQELVREVYKRYPHFRVNSIFQD